MDASNEGRVMDEGTSDGNFVYVRVNDNRVRIMNQDEETILDFLKDETIANRLARRMNIHGIPEDCYPV